MRHLFPAAARPRALSVIFATALLATASAAATAQVRRDNDPVDPEERLEEELASPYYAISGGFTRAQRPIVDRIPMRRVTDPGGTLFVDVIYARGVGQILTDTNHMTLYATDRDREFGVSSLDADALSQWKPIIVSKSLDVGGFYGKAWSEALQAWVLTFADKPLYRFSGDKEPGDAQGRGDGWYMLEVVG